MTAYSEQERSQFVFWGSQIQLPPLSSSTPPIFSFPFSVTADVDLPPSGGDGVLVAAGSKFGGWSFYLQDGRPVAYSAAGIQVGDMQKIAASRAIEPGHATIRFDFEPKGKGGSLTISANGVVLANEEIVARPLMNAGLYETFDIGQDTGVPVSPDYQDGGVFDGQIRKIDIDIKRVHAQ